MIRQIKFRKNYDLIQLNIADKEIYHITMFDNTNEDIEQLREQLKSIFKNETLQKLKETENIYTNKSPQKNYKVTCCRVHNAHLTIRCTSVFCEDCPFDCDKIEYAKFLLIIKTFIAYLSNEIRRNGYDCI